MYIIVYKYILFVNTFWSVSFHINVWISPVLARRRLRTCLTSQTSIIYPIWKQYDGLHCFGSRASDCFLYDHSLHRLHRLPPLSIWSLSKIFTKYSCVPTQMRLGREWQKHERVNCIPIHGLAIMISTRMISIFCSESHSLMFPPTRSQ